MTQWLCLWTEFVNGDPPTLSISCQRKTTHWWDGVRLSWGLSLLCSFHSSMSLPFFHFLSLCNLFNLGSAFGGVLHKSWTSPPGKWGSLIEKEIRNENSHSFSSLCYVKARKCTSGNKTKCTRESVKEIGRVLTTKWKGSSLTSLPASQLPLMTLDFFQ